MVDRRKRREQWASRQAKTRPKQAMRLEGSIVGNQCWIEVLVGNPDVAMSGNLVDADKLVHVRALIDTGATSTCINRELAARLGLRARTPTKVSGLGGTHDGGQAPTVVGFQYKGTTFHRIIPMLILPLDYPMLLGMADIVAGTLYIDGPKQRWSWALSRERVREVS